MDYSLWGCQELDTTKQLSLNRPQVSQMVQNIKQYQARKFFFKFLNYPIHSIYSTDMKFTYCLSRLDNFLIVSVCSCKCLCFAHALSRCQLGYRNLHLQHLEKSYDKYRQHIKKQRHHFADKGPHSQSYVFSSGHIQM